MCRMLVALLCLVPALPLAQPHRTLSFHDRLAAEEAIARVYYAHQLGALLPFEKAVPRSALEKRLIDSLERSAALEETWRVPVTSLSLQRELERIVRNSRSPDKLQEILTAMNGDVFLLMETLVRSTLVARLSESFFAHDRVIHAATRIRADEYRESLLSGKAPRAPRSIEVEFRHVPDDGSSSQGRVNSTGWIEELDDVEFARRAARLPSGDGGIGPVVEGPDSFSIAQVVSRSADRIVMRTHVFPKVSWSEWWTRSHGSSIPDITAVAEPDPAGWPGRHHIGPMACDDNVWSAGVLDDPPDPRTGHSMVWTGNEVIAWGGNGNYGNSSGGRYDPLTDTWSSTSLMGAPNRRSGHSAVWTGTEMIIWGGMSVDAIDNDFYQDGALYNPLTDSWRPMTIVSAPTARHRHSTVWTGTEMIVYGGNDARMGISNTGGRYAPATDTWRPIWSWDIRTDHEAVWTGTRMIVVGGYNATSQPPTCASYSPDTDTWAGIPLQIGTVGITGHTAVWGAGRMMVWGGSSPWGSASSSSYDPASSSWSYISNSGSPVQRTRHTAVWTGTHMMIWGGMVGGVGTVNSGGLYDPVSNTWSPVAAANAPTARYDAPGVWTGSQAIIWGGEPSAGRALGTGARYDPLAGMWTPTSTGGNPSPRGSHTAVWTGNEMMVWGGWGTLWDGMVYIPLQTGGLYDPALDSWRWTSLASAPDARSRHSMVWTGEVAIVWGGGLSSGGRYDPWADAWSPTSLVGAPQGRFDYGAAWTGGEMIVWGGYADWPIRLSDGARYDPLLDRWLPMSNVGAPNVRSSPAFIWTGHSVIVWAGDGAYPRLSGALYDPVADTWSPMSTSGASTVQYPSAVWTGTEMIVNGGSNEPSRGGRYSPDTDTWRLISTQNAVWGTAIWADEEMLIWRSHGSGPGEAAYYAPVTDTWSHASIDGAPPFHPSSSMVWTGNSVIIWGGQSGQSGFPSSLGGRLHLMASPDDDMDGQRVCRGDCDDTSVTVSAGAAQICGDGLNNDCLSPAWPSLATTNEADDDGDTLSECEGDCDDAHALVRPGGAQFCGDRLNNDCNDPSWPAVPPEEQDLDGDGAGICQGDCDDADPLRYPGSPELDDGLDNQCPGDPGYGLVDEVGDVWFTSGTPPKFCWMVMEPAASYETLRAGHARLTSGCVIAEAGPLPTCWSDADLPATGSVFYYLVRPSSPYAGSWGAGSDGVERVMGCSTGFCGDGVRNGSELCDGSDLGDESCLTQGYDSGTLRCTTSCSGFDTSGCRL